jgi:hypothetical protein
MMTESNVQIREMVRRKYAEIARGQDSCCASTSSCCESSADDAHRIPVAPALPPAAKAAPMMRETTT